MNTQPESESPRPGGMTAKQGAEKSPAEQIGRLTRRSLLVGGAVSAAGALAGGWLATRPLADGIQWPLRSVLDFNERLSRGLMRETKLAPAFAPGAAAQGAEMQVNGRIGLAKPLDIDRWKLEVTSDAGMPLTFSLDDIKAVPPTEMITEFKCIEGWSQVFWWTGAALADFVHRHGLGTRSGRPADPRGDRSDFYRYVALETPDRGYYVGLDLASALHPQTLLAYSMGGEPLSQLHGAPLRLAIPVKYGIKSIKRIGRIRFTDQRPADYWAERGYDWYAGH